MKLKKQKTVEQSPIRFGDVPIVLSKYTNLANKRRGEFIEEVIKLERVMDEFICNYFTSDPLKNQELMFVVFGTMRMTYENKRQVLEYIVKSHRTSVTMKHPDILKHMQYAGEIRNILAHQELEIKGAPNGVKDDTTILKKYMDSIEYIVIDKDFIDQWMLNTRFCMQVLHAEK